MKVGPNGELLGAPLGDRGSVPTAVNQDAEHDGLCDSRVKVEGLPPPGETIHMFC